MSNSRTPTAQRKNDHLQIVEEHPVSVASVSTGFERFRLMHCALPEVDFDDISTSTRFLHRSLRVPILISGMTGGIERGALINQRLAAAAEAFGCAMGVGSQRVAIEDPDQARHFRLREVAPNILLFANLGAVQLNYGYGVTECQRAVEMIEADALVLHLNPLQEALQDHGNTRWSGLLRQIERVCTSLDVPVIVKEVGWGISARIARQLEAAGVAAIDVGGAGGTSWSEVERHRAATPALANLCEAFAQWGIPTAESLRMTRAVTSLPVIASGGLRTGIDAAKALALGADLVGFAAPLLRAAAASPEGASEALAAIVAELRLSMFCCGAADLAHLRGTELVAEPRGWP